MELSEKELSILCWALNTTQDETFYMYDPHPGSLLSRESDEFWVSASRSLGRGFQRLSSVPASARLEALHCRMGMGPDRLAIHTLDEVKALIHRLEN